MHMPAPPLQNYRASISVPMDAAHARTAIFDEMHLWWTLRAERTPDGVTARFNNSHVTFVFDTNQPLIWRCTDAHMIIEDVADTTEWTGTCLHWTITPTSDGCDITLEHKGLNASLDCLDVCTRGWQHFFENSLLAHLSGQTPAPETR
ncbi:hypothetical protein [Shimia sp.]|uniref:hypothetical protein n=1 Tax=Shimia sp. TaxID=1954381 RepID=UPI003BACFFD4